MDQRPKIGLDNPAFNGRLRPPRQAPSAPDVPAPMPNPAPAPTPVPDPDPGPSDPKPVPPPAMASLPVVKPEPFAQPAQSKQQPSSVLQRQAVSAPEAPSLNLNLKPRRRLAQAALLCLAVVAVVGGVVYGRQTINHNRQLAAQIGALNTAVNKKAESQKLKSVGPEVGKISAETIQQYTTAPEQPRYLKIPKFESTARVLALGVKADGSFTMPDNINDVAWQSGSAKPGQPGATFIYGYANSNTNPGAFLKADNLVAGDTVQVVRGDNALLTYRVIKIETYEAGNSDLSRAFQPVTAGKGGLNIWVHGVRSAEGTNSNRQLLIFAEQI